MAHLLCTLYETGKWSVSAYSPGFVPNEVVTETGRPVSGAAVGLEPTTPGLTDNPRPSARSMSDEVRPRTSRALPLSYAAREHAGVDVKAWKSRWDVW